MNKFNFWQLHIEDTLDEMADYTITTETAEQATEDLYKVKAKITKDFIIDSLMFAGLTAFGCSLVLFMGWEQIYAFNEESKFTLFLIALLVSAYGLTFSFTFAILMYVERKILKVIESLKVMKPEMSDKALNGEHKDHWLSQRIKAQGRPLFRFEYNYLMNIKNE